MLASSKVLTPIKTRVPIFEKIILTYNCRFFVDTPNEKGGRFFIPSTHFRNIRMSEIDIYQHMRGKISVVAQPEQFVFGIRGFGTALGPTEPKVQDICTN